MDVEQLLKALDNDENENLINMTSEKLNNMKREILTEIQLSPQEVAEYMQKLKEYKYIDEIFEIKCGKYIRTIPISYLPPTLSRGGIVVGIDFTDTGTYLLCKNNCNRIFKVGFDKHLIFQKLSEDELLYLTASEYIGR
jgi:hypothetical protein